MHMAAAEVLAGAIPMHMPMHMGAVAAVLAVAAMDTWWWVAKLLRGGELWGREL